MSENLINLEAKVNKFKILVIEGEKIIKEIDNQNPLDFIDKVYGSV